MSISTVDWPSWISAGAAVVQAVGAGLAIWFSVKLARESADREIAAGLAFQAREEQADQRAEARLLRAKEADDLRYRSEQQARHNAPIERALQLCEQALADYSAQLADNYNAAQVNPDQIGSVNATHAQKACSEMREALMREAPTGPSTTAIDEAMASLAMSNGFIVAPVKDIVRGLEQRMESIPPKLETLRQLLIYSVA